MKHNWRAGGPRWLSATPCLLVSLILASCGGGGASGGSSAPSTSNTSSNGSSSSGSSSSGASTSSSSSSSSGASSYTIGGTISGLSASGLVLANGNLEPVDAGATSFVIPGTVSSGNSYAVTVAREPTQQSCEVTQGTGTVSTSDVTTVTVGCVSGTWNWLAGSTTQGAAGSYGSQGQGSPLNIPSSRLGAVSWTDPAGNFWLFGGSFGSSSGDMFNDLWEYSPPTGNWTWVSGASTFNAVGVYGSQGVAATGNDPGARAFAAGWTDTTGNLWLFGGQVYFTGGSQSLNDLWEFSPSSGQWTWVAGSDGQTVDTTGDVPPPLQTGVAASTWTDSAGNFWLYDNPLWKFSPTSRQWNQVGAVVTNGDSVSGAVYGTQGVAASGNYPGARYGAAAWVDGQGNFWLFGGGLSPCTDDMWEFSSATGEWEWVSGSNYLQIQNAFSDADYGTLGVAAASNSPGCRVGSMSWADGQGNLWLYGGYGYEASSTEGDLWEYSIAAKLWTWEGGGLPGALSASPVYGTMGTASPNNSPGANTGAVTWVGGGKLWLFGGANGSPGANPHAPASESPYDDLWVFTP